MQVLTFIAFAALVGQCIALTYRKRGNDGGIITREIVISENGETKLHQVLEQQEGRQVSQAKNLTTFDVRRVRKSNHAGNTYRVMIRYLNEQGKRDTLALADARGAKVYHEFDDEHLVALDLDAESIMYLDEVDDNILTVDIDDIWTQQGRFERYVDDLEFDDAEESSVRGGGRKLGEDIPYGITMVQGNQVQIGSAPIKVCIADTGFARMHPDLKDLSQVSGTDSHTFSDEEGGAWDEDKRGHGSHVAGTISAVINNGIGVRGISDKIPLHIARALDNNGDASESDVFSAIRDCAASGAKIISMSLAGGSMSSTFKEYLNKLYDEKDILVIGASGNDGANVKRYPSALSYVMSVAAVTENGDQWYDSNWGEWVDVAAPGKSVLSTTTKNYGTTYTYSYFSGTSMAVPHVTGVAAVVWSHFPECKNYQIRYALAISAKELAGGCNEKFGNGLVQAKTAYDFLKANPCDVGNWGTKVSNGGCSTVSTSQKQEFLRTGRIGDNGMSGGSPVDKETRKANRAAKRAAKRQRREEKRRRMKRG